MANPVLLVVKREEGESKAEVFDLYGDGTKVGDFFMLRKSYHIYAVARTRCPHWPDIHPAMEKFIEAADAKEPTAIAAAFTELQGCFRHMRDHWDEYQQASSTPADSAEQRPA